MALGILHVPGLKKDHSTLSIVATGVLPTCLFVSHSLLIGHCYIVERATLLQCDRMHTQLVTPGTATFLNKAAF